MRPFIEDALASRFHTEETGDLNTQMVLLAGIGAVVAIALGFIIYRNVTGAAEQIDMDFNQIGMIWFHFTSLL